jgi:MFS family permease
MGHSMGMLTGPVVAGFMMDTFHLSLAFVGGAVVMGVGVVVALIFTSGFQRWVEEKQGVIDKKATLV